MLIVDFKLNFQLKTTQNFQSTDEIDCDKRNFPTLDCQQSLIFLPKLPGYHRVTFEYTQAKRNEGVILCLLFYDSADQETSWDDFNFFKATGLNCKQSTATCSTIFSKCYYRLLFFPV